MAKAVLETIETPDRFRQGLAGEEGPFQVLVDPSLEPVALHRLSGKEAAALFETCRQAYPFHLSFRAFNGLVEYAWFGTSGVIVREAAEGPFELGESTEVLDHRGEKAKVQYLLARGGRIYQKLMEVRDEVREG